MKPTQNAQTRALRSLLIRKASLYLLIFTAAFIAVSFWAETYIVPDLANCIADSTSQWMYYSPEAYDQIVESGQHAWLQNSEVYATTAADGTMQYAMRDLTFYNMIKGFKIPVALCLFFAGIIIIAFWTTNTSLRYFDTLTNSVEDLITTKDLNVDLPNELSSVRSELVEIKARSLTAEHAAEGAEQRKNELVAYLAHDIKTPLTSILGYLSILEDSPDLPIEQRASFARIALDKAEHLEELIEEFFEITRYNLQSIPIERETLNVALFCQQIADEFYPAAQQRNITIGINAPEQATFFVDPNKLARAASNIMRNALAYADEQSTIVITAQQTQSDTTLSVADQGKEISPIHLQTIFEKFYREDRARNAQQGGAGLGLAIAKEIVAAHGGTIHATSEKGLTTFTIELPL